MKITSTDFINDYGRIADRALTEPLTITKDGLDYLIILSAQEYERLKQRDRSVIAAGSLSEAEVTLISGSEVPAEYAHLDRELEDWRP